MPAGRQSCYLPTWTVKVPSCTVPSVFSPARRRVNWSVPESGIRRVVDDIALDRLARAQIGIAVFRELCRDRAVLDVNLAVGRLLDDARIGESRKGAVLFHERSTRNLRLLAGAALPEKWLCFAPPMGVPTQPESATPAASIRPKEIRDMFFIRFSSFEIGGYEMAGTRQSRPLPTIEHLYRN